MINTEKRNKVNKAVHQFHHLIKYGSGIIRLETELDLRMQRIFKKQANLFWEMESKNKWLDKIYVKAQADRSKIEKFGMVEGLEGEKKFVGQLTEEWYTEISNDKTMGKVLNKNYIDGYNFAGQEVLNEFAIKEGFKLSNVNVLESLTSRANLITGQVNATSWESLQGKIANSFWREGKDPDKVARDIRGLFDETYKHRALTIARTETGEIVSEAQFKSYEKMGIPELEWLIEPGADKVCLPLKGQKRKTGEDFSNGLGWTGRHPLVHPNCRCDVKAIIPKNYKPSTYWTGN